MNGPTVSGPPEKTWVSLGWAHVARGSWLEYKNLQFHQSRRAEFQGDELYLAPTVGLGLSWGWNTRVYGGIYKGWNPTQLMLWDFFHKSWNKDQKKTARYFMVQIPGCFFFMAQMGGPIRSPLKRIPSWDPILQGEVFVRFSGETLVLFHLWDCLVGAKRSTTSRKMTICPGDPGKVCLDVFGGCMGRV